MDKNRTKWFLILNFLIDLMQESIERFCFLNIWTIFQIPLQDSTEMRFPPGKLIGIS